MSGAEREAGYATAAAAVICLTLAMTVSAAVAASVAELRSARAELRQAEAEYAVAGTQARALEILAHSPSGGRLAWRFPAEGGEASVLAEPEETKLAPAQAALLEDAHLKRFGVTDAAALRTRLAALSKNSVTAVALDAADAAPGWRACAASAISASGQGRKLAVGPATAPEAEAGAHHAGETWRLRISLGGWTEDRVVRLTGDQFQPAAIVERRLYRGEGGEQCESLIGQG
jgi:hypothetical protein